MASRILDGLGNRGLHEIGNLCAWKIKTVPYGAKCTEVIDNFLLVELSYDADGGRLCKTLAAIGNPAHLIASPENRMLGNVAVEELVDFYNGINDMGRIVVIEQGLRFDTSAFSYNAGVTANNVATGMLAHFDPATKKYIISTVLAPHADYAGSSVKFEVANVELDTNYTLCGKKLIRLEVQ